MSNPIPAAPKPSAPKANLLPVLLSTKNTKSKPKRVYTPPAHLTQKIGDFFPAELTMQFQNR